ncbi:MAG: NADH-ubiquinone oxidoreductase-F iron-sulfur binding region domain-containing protein [Anaerolineae bacterium]|jgi:NADH:ubiquinone oxidoreductase subunit F (NADH-binding)/(2Fe-2S) ferredoxin/Pyruvate/2-oxoacid:ferredoxin oxidoreductase delta subunit|nr:NADH-ubiquinone oxidoreductase-F iron-sulfur binding region domain-containing protein [Anaerolineae bacterium]
MAYRAHVLISGEPRCVAKGAREVEAALVDKLHELLLGDEVQVMEVSSLGHGDKGPELVIYPDGINYVNVTPEDARFIVEEHLLKGRPVDRLMYKELPEPLEAPATKEVRVVLENVGRIDPNNIEDYIAFDGYAAMAKVLTEMTPEEVLDVLKQSGLRGRGGAGFPTWLKWTFARQAVGEKKFIICNGDEGDPGAFMNRRVLEGDPHAVIEGMIIAAYAIGAQQGYFYVRAEYPIAIRTLRVALQQAREYGLLGENILGSGFNFDLEIRMGAGAFVCGEETALMQSIEGDRGMPRTRPPFPAASGLWKSPTNINNVETYANVPKILLKGPEWFASMGTEKSKGTKTFAVAGKVKRTGLIEVPLGITLREVVYDVGGGILNDKKFKAVQTGGPMGGCIPEQYLDMPVDYESLASLGSIMGSGGMVIMDEDTCMVDIARFFMEFVQEESCGKCVPCRVGTRRMLEILNNICEGKGQPGDIELLESMSQQIIDGALCGLGKGAPNPVLSTIKFFREEYEAHIYEKKCPAKVCKALITYDINPDVCIGCTRCARNCPVQAISGKAKETHVIDASICIRCGVCKQVCPVGAVNVG